MAEAQWKTWNISLSYSVAAENLNLAVSGLILMTVMTIVRAFMFAVWWVLSIVSNPGVVDNNPINQKLGCSIFCVGLDTQPAKSPRLILFVDGSFVCLPCLRSNMPDTTHVQKSGLILFIAVYSVPIRCSNRLDGNGKESTLIIGPSIFEVVGYMKEIIFTIFGQKNFVLAKDRVCLSSSAVFLVCFPVHPRRSDFARYPVPGVRIVALLRCAEQGSVSAFTTVS